MSKQSSSERNPLPSSSSSSSTLNRSFHENPPFSSSTLNPSPSTHRSPLPSSSTLNNPSPSTRNPSLEVGQSSSLEHIRLRWTADLHRRFLNAVEFLGGERSATPRAIIDLMKEKDLTLNQVSSHLQIYRNFCFAQQRATREVETAVAQMGLTTGQNYVWLAPDHYQQVYPYGHQFYTAPPPHLPWWPQPLPLPGPPRLYIDPVGPMPPSIPPLMRMMNFSTSGQETILFEELFQECRKRPIDVVSVDDEVDEEEENVRLELMPGGGGAAKRPKVDLTLTIKPPVNESPNRSRPHA